jgi:hypothetical protein
LAIRGGKPPEEEGEFMKRVLVVALVALAAVALYAATAPAGQQAVTPKQFAALQKRVAKLEKDNKDITDAVVFMISCGFDKGAIAITKAPQFHITAPGEATDFFALTTSDPQCVSAINSPLARKVLQKVKG